MSNDPYPLYDVPWLVREHNEYYMSAERHEIELFNQTVVDDYFIARSKGIPAREARQLSAAMHGITVQRTDRIIRWFFEEAKKRRKYDFLEKFLPLEEH